ncbi:unnamed protein product [Adineta steineri]|uniref:Uncharacterized protein n=1 Tax=Adineta steineri TaxID=433720 RepID=A0A819GK91_9BILA|nr:unnamed protein product [Adineta steineri]CAF3883134.1 unnamed protein product [Adineta steineri]
MYTNVSNSSKHSYRDKCTPPRQVVLRTQPNNNRVALVHERKYTIRLRRRRAQQTRSFYDNTEGDESEPIVSKWTIVRQRLPDILALSGTYKPSSIRAQLVLLVALMNKQTHEQMNEQYQLMRNEQNGVMSHRMPDSVTINTSGRTREICLKRIPSQQMIHVDTDTLAFSVPTRQFILAISRGNTHETAAKFCPPAISDMLIDLSKIKIIDDRRQFKRAQFKMRLGQSLFFFVFIFIITMMFALTLSTTNLILNDAWNNPIKPPGPNKSLNSTSGDGPPQLKKILSSLESILTSLNITLISLNYNLTLLDSVLTLRNSTLLNSTSSW